jgi:hypothetical protein
MSKPRSRPRPRRLRRRLVRRPLRLAAFTGGGVAVIMVAVLVATWLWWRPDPSAQQRSRGLNALWLRHQWVGEPRTPGEYAALAARLRDAHISDAFFHVGPLDGDGTIPPGRYAHARTLLAALARSAPDVRPQAYVGQVERDGGGPLDLDDPAVRQAVERTAGQLLALGFEGIHYDIEPIQPGNQAFLDLLERTRHHTQARGAVLSVALEELAVTEGLWQAADAIPGVRLPTLQSGAYLRQVADRVDQVAIMTYGSFLPADWLFGRYVAWQTERTVELIGDRATVFMGVPTEDHPLRPAETIRSGLRGVQKGLDATGAVAARGVGVAVFAEWTTSPAEWGAYHDIWVAPGRST